MIQVWSKLSDSAILLDLLYDDLLCLLSFENLRVLTFLSDGLADG